MDGRYEAFSMADPVFYDALSAPTSPQSAFAVSSRDIPAGWGRTEQDDWIVLTPPDLDVPQQGWKIHVSACLDNADRVLDAVWDYCVPRTLEFKYLRSVEVLWLRSSKYAARGSSGKLITIYPVNDAECEKVLTELGAILQGEPGPYILSDLRWSDGPLYVRYGGFTFQYCVDESGQVVPGITNDQGELVPDRRDPVFRVPPWVRLPDFLAPHLAARNAVTVADLPYSIEQVIHFSNGGGVYRGRDTRTQAEVVLKEGRPHAGLDGHGADAVARLRREYEMLTRLAGVPGVPAAYELFPVGEHSFLAMEYVDGRPLNQVIVQKYPLIDVTAGPDRYAEYVSWALGVFERVQAAVLAMHERGVVYGDLHLFNILVRPDDSIALLDYEVATPIEEGLRPGLGNQGFVSRTPVTGFEADLYALACLRLALFFPITQLIWLSWHKAAHFSEVIAEHFPVPREFLAKAVEVICPAEPEPLDTSLDWTVLRDGMVRGIAASATPDREDRLFPGDIDQFRPGGGLGLANGAAGVLYALDMAGAPRRPEWEEWLLRQAKTPASGSMLGLYDGLHGVAFALEHLGHRAEALTLLDLCLAEDWEKLGPDLLGGLAGIGLNLDHFAGRTGESGYARAALRAAELIAERLGDETSVGEISGAGNSFAGLMRGSSGAAWLLMRAYDRTGDSSFLDSAAVALRQDLRRCRVRDNGTLEVNEGWRTMPYLAAGSVGVGMALDEYLARRHDEQFAVASGQVGGAARSAFYVQPGVFAGRAGMLFYLGRQLDDPAADADVLAQLRALAWHRVSYEDGTAYPGHQLLRLSMDLATGTAGVLLATASVLHRPLHLPLLEPHRPPSPHADRRARIATS